MRAHNEYLKCFDMNVNEVFALILFTYVEVLRIG